MYMYMYMYIYIGKYVLQTRILSLSLSISSSSLSLSSPSLWIHRGLGAWGGSRRQRPVKDKIVTRVWRWLLWSSQDLVDALYNDDDKDVDNYYEDMPVHFPIASLWSIRAAGVAVLISCRPVWLRPAQVSVHSLKDPRTSLCSRLKAFLPTPASVSIALLITRLEYLLWFLTICSLFPWLSGWYLADRD